MDDVRFSSSRPFDPRSHLGDGVADIAAEKMLGLEVQRYGEAVTVVVSGEIDLLTADRLKATLADEISAGPKILVIDLDGVQFFGSMGLSALALTQRAARERGVDLRVVTSGRATLRPLQITGMLDHLAVYASRSEALAGCSGRD